MSGLQLHAIPYGNVIKLHLITITFNYPNADGSTFFTFIVAPLRTEKYF